MPDYPDLPPVSEDPNQPLPDVAPDSELVPYRIGRKDPGGEYQYTTGYAPRGRPAIAPPQGMGFSGAGVPDLSPLISEAFQRLPVDEALKAVEAASRYIGQRGYMKDLESGQNAAQAFAKWGPMLFRQATGLPEAINRTVPTPLSQMQRYQIARNRPLDEALIAERQARAAAGTQMTPYQQAQIDLRKAAAAAKAEEAKNKPKKSASVTVPLNPDNPDGAKVTGPADDPFVMEAVKRHEEATKVKPMPPQPGILERARNFLVGAQQPAPTPVATPPPVSQEKITTKEQYDALPSGTVYTGKDGKKYRKP